MENKKTEKLKMDEKAALVKRAESALEYVKGLEVKNQEELTIANKVIVRIKIVIKDINDYFNAPIQKVHAAHKELIKMKKEALAPAEEAVKTLTPLIGGYLEAERRKREEAERRAAIKEAEDKRKADEAMAEAAKLEQEGKVDEALDVLDKATEIEETREKAIIPDAPKTEGVSTTRRWTYSVISEIDVPRDCMSLDKTKINAKIKAGVREIPGLRIYQDVSISVRTG